MIELHAEEVNFAININRFWGSWYGKQHQVQHIILLKLPPLKPLSLCSFFIHLF